MNRLPSLSLIVGALLACGVPSLRAQDWAKAKLEQSTRHREYVPVKHDGRTVNTLVIYPESKDKTPVVVLIHEIFGLSDWMKLQADELAAQGYIVLAPDLLSGLGANGGGTDALGGQDNVIKAVMALDPAQVTADLDAVADYGKTLPSASGALFTGGFCWGGGKTFAFATHRADLSAAFVFYGPPPGGGRHGEDHGSGLRVLRRQRQPRQRHDPAGHRGHEDRRQGVRARDVRRRGPRVHARGTGPRRQARRQESVRGRFRADAERVEGTRGRCGQTAVTE